MKIKIVFGKLVLFILTFFLLINGLFAQTESSTRNLTYWSLNGGVHTSNILVDAFSFGLVVEPRFDLPWLNLMIGSKNGISVSTDKIISLEAQVYLRWNFLRFPAGNFGRTLNVFVQGGVGFLGSLKGPYDRFDVRDSRSSILGDLTLGVTIPFSSRWQIEPAVRGGFPFMFGAALTAGYRFPLTKETFHYSTAETVHETVREVETIREVELVREVEVLREIETVRQEYITRTEYVDVINRLMIAQVEYILFAGDISRYNVNLDADARSLNDLVLNEVAKMLIENPDFRANIEGHANPVTGDPDEVQILFALSSNRAHEVARLLRERGVREDQLIVVAFGAGKVLATDRAHWNLNRRVELIIYQAERL